MSKTRRPNRPAIISIIRPSQWAREWLKLNPTQGPKLTLPCS